MKSLVRPRTWPRPLAPLLGPFSLSRFNPLLVLLLGFIFLSTADAQFTGLKITKIEIRHRGPVSVSDDLIRANIRVKVGDPYLVPAVDDDVRNLYATGFFYNIQVARE